MHHVPGPKATVIRRSFSPYFLLVRCQENLFLLLSNFRHICLILEKFEAILESDNSPGITSGQISGLDRPLMTSFVVRMSGSVSITYCIIGKESDAL